MGMRTPIAASDTTAPAPPKAPAKPWWRKLLRLLMVVLVFPWLGFTLLVWALQEQMIFPAGSLVDADPGSIGLEFEHLTLATADNEQLDGWWIPHPTASHTVLFCHGNAGTIADRISTVQVWHGLGLNVLLVDWRGYGRSSGSPSETGLYADGEAMYHYLTNERRIAPTQIIAHGRSLGGGVASYLAQKHDLAGLILESTFTRLADVAQRQLPFVPARLLLRHHFPTIDRLPSISEPIMVIHAEADETIPYDLGEANFAAAGEPKRFLTIHGSHNSGYMLDEARYRHGLRAFVASLVNHTRQSATK